MPSFFKNARDPISSYSHFIGAGLSVVGLAAMLVLFSVHGAAQITALSCLSFCFSLIALYCTSGVYHFSRAKEKVIMLLRKLDHAMIYVLIAGSYTPILLFILPKEKAVWFTVGIWAFALAGIVFKMCWMNAPRWLGTSLYILMGWAIMVDPAALMTLTPGAGILLGAGGVFYTIGGVIYLIKKPNISKDFGFHELFHIFVILGSLFHYLMVFFFIAAVV